MSASPFRSERLLFTPTHSAPDALSLILAFPNTYSVGITSLGYQVVWALLAQRADVEVSRLFTDHQEVLPSHPDLLGFSMSWELDYANILGILEQLKLPIWSRDRCQDHPLVFGGGPVLTANPEPFADFFDVILLGDGEELLGQFIAAYKQVSRVARAEQLHHLAQVPGVYVPSLYAVEYEGTEGAIATLSPIHPDIPAQVSKQTYKGNTLSSSTVVTERAAWESIYMVEVVRSCPEMCRFCLASYLTLPFRTPDVTETLLPAIERGLTVTNRIGLLGASVTQHPEFEALLDYFDRPACDDVRLSIASVRASTVTAKLAQTLAQHDTRSITIAIESGSERMRQLVNKKLEPAQIEAAASHAKQGGLKGIKFYGMVGLPTETPADVEATVALLKTLKRNVPGLRFTLGCSTFVPKAHTPFQWLGVDPAAPKRLQFLQKKLRKDGIDVRPESYNWSVIQALLSRGDRRLAPLLALTRHYGDSVGSYKRAFKDLRGQLPNLDYYVFERWPVEQVLPWQHLQGPVALPVLAKHLDQALTLP